MTRRPLFTRYLVIAAASVLVVSALALAGFAGGLSGAPLGVTAVIIVGACAVSFYAGRLHWHADTVIAVRNKPIRDQALEQLRHKAALVFYAVALFQVLGMIGALLGYREQTKAAALPDAHAAVAQLTLGLGSGLTATLAGVLCSVCVWVMFLHLQHAIDRPH